MITAFVTLLIVGLILGVLWLAVDWVGGLFSMPDPFRKALKGVIALIAILVLVNFLLQLSGQPGFVKWR